MARLLELVGRLFPGEVRIEAHGKMTCEVECMKSAGMQECCTTTLVCMPTMSVGLRQASGVHLCEYACENTARADGSCHWVLAQGQPANCPRAEAG